MELQPKDKPFVIRKKFYLALASWMVFGMMFLYLALVYSNYFLIPLFLLFFSIGFWTLSLRCPRCNKQIILNPVIFGIYGYTPWLPYNCTQCDLEFD